MSSIGTGYDLSASQFSPDGRVFQVEYASKAVENSGTVIGMRGKDGIVFAAEKLVITKLHESSANRRIWRIDTNIGMAAAGLIADARKLAEIARKEASDYRNQYGVTIPVKELTKRVSMYIHAYTLYSAVRPFGVNCLIGGYDKVHGAELYMIEPSGVSWGYYGCTAGKAQQGAKTEIEKLKLVDMTCDEIVKKAAKIIYGVHDSVKDKDFILEMGWCCEQSGGIFEEIPKNITLEAEDLAKKALEEDEDTEMA
ncbi:proteasome subunit alpha type-3-like [Paramacrobiotus metropolitanus]|uniref:proteasome subunit alpha type-3-like n=1 Tax=Paramacrobiotus metropolitanus TaxID=2943436 RepID=UPI002445B44B|nr:proteasome subunit alpha type-3-like [Paramacrobiotus metropolitanus]